MTPHPTSDRPAPLVLTKHHGLGNDFLLLLDERNAAAVEATPALARRLSERGVPYQESAVGLLVAPGPGQGAPLIVQPGR